MLKQQGYATGIFGKWHLGVGLKTGKDVDYNAPLVPGPNDAGFDRWYGLLNGHNIGPYVWSEDRGIHALQPGQRIASTKDRPPPPTGRVDTEVGLVLADQVDAFLAANQDKPFFLYYPTPQIHYPLTPNPRFKTKGLNSYGGFVVEFDWCVGRVLAKLDQLKLTQNTLILLSSDNGAYLGQKWPTNGPLRAQKASIYEGGHREPFLARWPGHIPAGTTCNETICLTDIMATCAAITGAQLPPNAAEDSYNILPALRGERLSGPIREGTMAVGRLTDKGFVQENPNYYSLAQGPWKLIVHGSAIGAADVPDDGSDDGPASVEGKLVKKQAGKQKKEKRTGSGPGGIAPAELYNLKDDLGEKRNLASQHPEIVQRLKELLAKYVAQGFSRLGAQGKGGINSP
jgi:arylsulfatase A-like enzyme